MADTTPSPSGSPLDPPPLSSAAAIPASLRRWWSGMPSVLLRETGVFLLPGLLPLRDTDRVLIVGPSAPAIAELLDSRVEPEQPPVAQASFERELDADDGTFTVVICGHQQHDWDDDRLLVFLEEAWRVLTHNGLVVLWDVAPSRSTRVSGVWRRLLGASPDQFRLRTFAETGRRGREAGFAWIQTLNLRPFLWPPGPRLALLMRKEHYDEETIELAEGETPPPRSV